MQCTQVCPVQALSGQARSLALLVQLWMFRPGRRLSLPRRATQPARADAATISLKRRWSTSGKSAWLKGVMNDFHGNNAKRQGYRSRAAAKLVQLDERFKLLRPGQTVVELGAAPGSWTQVAVQRVNSCVSPMEAKGKQGSVIAADINRMDPVKGATVLQLDLTDPSDVSVLRHHLQTAAKAGTPQCDVLLSDMAPATTGQQSLDHHRSMVLGSIALRLSRDLLAPGGAAVVKVFQGGTEQRLLRWAKLHFETARFAKPAASKKHSKEVFLVASGFRTSGVRTKPAEP